MTSPQQNNRPQQLRNDLDDLFVAVTDTQGLVEKNRLGLKHLQATADRRFNSIEETQQSHGAALRRLVAGQHRHTDILEGHNARFESIDARFESIDGRLEGHDAWLNSIDSRLEKHGETLEKIVSLLTDKN